MGYTPNTGWFILGSVIWGKMAVADRGYVHIPNYCCRLTYLYNIGSKNQQQQNSTVAGGAYSETETNFVESKQFSFLLEESISSPRSIAEQQEQG